MSLATVAVIEESARKREALKALLACSSEFRLVASVADIAGLKRRIAGIQLQLLLMSSTSSEASSLVRVQRLQAELATHVVLMTETKESSDSLRVKARPYGILSVLAKPRPQPAGWTNEFFQQLRTALSMSCVTPPALPRRTRLASVDWGKFGALGEEQVIAVGASTGGIEATTAMLRKFPADAPPVLVVQHIRNEFADKYAQALDSVCRGHVRVAKPGDQLVPGRVLVAPGDAHMSLAREMGRLVIRTDRGPLVNSHRPAVDRLFQSLVRCRVRKAAGVLLTGHGERRCQGASRDAQRGNENVRARPSFFSCLRNAAGRGRNGCCGSVCFNRWDGGGRHPAFLGEPLMTLNVLVIDDSSVMRKMITRSLRQTGLDLAVAGEAGNGVEGLSALGGGSFDLILCDWNMPEMNGLEFIKAARKEYKTPIVMLTTETSQDRVMEAMEAGCRRLRDQAIYTRQAHDQAEHDPQPLRKEDSHDQHRSRRVSHW